MLAHNLRWHYAWRDLWRNKTRTALVILSIAVGIFAFGAILGAGNLLRRELRTNYLAIHPASATLHTSPFDEEMVESIRRMPDVALAEGRASLVLRFALTPASDLGTESERGDRQWHDLQLFAVDDYSTNQINQIRPFQGAWPPPDKAILIERNSLFLTERQVGEQLLVETSSGDRRSLPIAGLAHDMNQPPAQITGIPYGYVTRDTLEWLGLPRRYNQLNLVVRNGQFDKAHITQVAQAAADKFERSGYTVQWSEVPEPGQHFVEEFLPTILLILTTLGVMALVLSGFLVVNVIGAILIQQTRQIGVMKAIGAQATQVTGLYLRMILIFGVCALLLAMPLGALGSQAFARFIAGQLNFDLERFWIAPSILLLEGLIGLLAPCLAALYPILATSRLTVREAVQDQGLQMSGSGAGVEWLLDGLQRLVALSRPLRLSLRNTFRRRGRLIRTLIPLMLGGAIFMSVLSVRASLFRTLEATLLSQGFDVQLQLDEAYHIQRVQQVTQAVTGIAALEIWTVQQAAPVHPDESQGDDVRVYGLPAQTRLFTPDLVAGRWLVPSDRNAIVIPTSLLSKEPGLGLGQAITLRIDGVENTWQVVGLNQVFQPPIAPPVLYINQPALWDELGNHSHANIVRVLTEQHDPATHQQVAQALEERLRATGIGIRSTRTASADRTIFTERFNIITTILLIMAFLLATVGSLGLTGAMSINVLERRREIGVMRAIGAPNHAILQIFVVEGMVIGLLSWVGALLLSQPISRLMSWRIGIAFAKMPLTYVYDLRAPLFWLVLVLLVSALASLTPARAAARLAVRETLAYE